MGMIIPKPIMMITNVANRIAIFRRFCVIPYERVLSRSSGENREIIAQAGNEGKIGG
jgi:hypothetical protein